MLLAVAIHACGDDADQADASTRGSKLDAGLDRPSSYQATLIPAAADDAGAYISVPHTISLLDELGNPLNPPVETTSGPEGQVNLPLPAAAASVYVVGVGPTDDDNSTYDTVLVSNNWKSGDPLLRISDRRTLALALQRADFTARADRASLRGTVYWATNGTRRGTVGCAKVYIDGATQPDEDQVQRYGGLLPVPLATQDQTSRLGTFYFGNIKVGLHSLRVSLDDGQTFLPTKSLFVGRTRPGAQSPTKAILYQFGVDLEATADPTPESCPR
ncbi:MAG: hypothetical protein ABW352_15945 [Polyangiales bacterium]